MCHEKYALSVILSKTNRKYVSNKNRPEAPDKVSGRSGTTVQSLRTSLREHWEIIRKATCVVLLAGYMGNKKHKMVYRRGNERNKTCGNLLKTIYSSFAQKGSGKNLLSLFIDSAVSWSLLKFCVSISMKYSTAKRPMIIEELLF